MSAAAPLLEIDDLRVHFDTDEGLVRAVDGVSVGVRDRIGGYYPHPSMLLEDWASIYVEADYLN